MNRNFVNYLLQKPSNRHNWFNRAWLMCRALVLYGCLSFVSAQALPYEEVSRAVHPLKVGVIISSSANKSNFINYERSCIVRGMARSYFLNNSDAQIRFIFEEVSDIYAMASAKAAQDLVKQSVQLAVLHLTSTQAEAAADVFSNAGIPYITSATSLNTIKPGYKGVSISSSNKTMSKIIARYFLANFQYRSIVVVPNLLNNYSDEFSELFKREIYSLDHRKHINTYPFGLENERLDDLVARIPDGAFVFAPLYNPKIGVLYNRLVRAGKKDIIFFGGNVPMNRTEFLKVSGGISEDVRALFISDWDIDHPATSKSTLEQRRAQSSIQRIVDAYCDVDGVTTHVTVAYDLMKILMAISDDFKEGTTPKELMRMIKQSPYSTVTTGNHFSFDDDGFAYKPMYLFEMTGEKLIHLETFEPLKP
ncbi:ABC transporter substrate-binding protein [Vibrio sp. Vb5035]|uniref:ABC transporter substrate-binding protein n=1 Tax=unclassified Vibrio TaxID=2614977 RepID=UPI002963D3F7|nr:MULTISPECIES: ABC transporter substrate-binding protein [unclassified Vibrio]MDW1517109.1 ABC transporter substrate-binding protein [Vibrio sp. Vb5035]MDW1547253.1 ABC transporter substrate-binding protein [Vibrio sp. Vb5034]